MESIDNPFYFGGTHLHTSSSLDASGDGNTKTGPDEAYGSAKGETVVGDDGTANRMSRPRTGYLSV
jgi:hypothetical protein